MTALFTCVNEPTKEVKHKMDRVRKSSSFFHLQRDVLYISVIPAFLHVTWLPQSPERTRQHSKGRGEPRCVQVPPPEITQALLGTGRGQLAPIISERKPFLYSEANTKPPDGNSFLSLSLKAGEQLSSLLSHQFYAESTAVSKNTEEPFACEV